MEKPTVYLLIRYTGNQEQFKAQLEAIQKQSYKQLAVVVQFSDPNDVEFMETIEESIKIPFRRVLARPVRKHAGRKAVVPENIFINRMLEFVEDGIVVVMNDNEEFCNRYAISRIVKDMAAGTARIAKVNFDDPVDARLVHYKSDLKGVLFDAQPNAGHRFMEGMKRNKVAIEVYEDKFLQRIA